jgi:hypothetical protein
MIVVVVVSDPTVYERGTKSFLEATFGALTLTDHVALISLRFFQSDGQELESSSKPSFGNVLAIVR